MLGYSTMPRVSEFFGIIIRMFHNDHNPSHFHAEYGGQEAIYSIETLELLRGNLPRRAHALVVEWATLHRRELQRNWQQARHGEALKTIKPLD